MGSFFALIGQHSPYSYIIVCRFRYNFRLIKTFLNDNKRKPIACFIYSFFLANTLIVRYFCKGLKKQEVRVSHKAETLIELNKKEITKEAQRDLFLFTDQLYQNSITNATSYSPSCNLSVYSFSSKTHHFLSHS